jgi:hypothetical protein
MTCRFNRLTGDCGRRCFHEGQLVHSLGSWRTFITKAGKHERACAYRVSLLCHGIPLATLNVVVLGDVAERDSYRAEGTGMWNGAQSSMISRV